MKRCVAFAVVYNLNKKDFEDGALLSRIERVITKAIGWFVPGIKSEDIIFSFPADPSVETSAIPVVVDVNWFWHRFESKESMLMAASIMTGVKKAFIKGERDDVLVIVRGIQPGDGFSVTT